MPVFYLVITERLTREAWSSPSAFWDFQRQFDAWLKGRGAAFQSVRHYITLVGEPLLETWLEYPDYASMEHDQKLLKDLERDPEWSTMLGRLYAYLERVGSRIVEEMPAPLAPE